jgi:regulator of sigma E protease
MNILIFIIILFILVVSHEFGHFVVAKKTGMRVDEFSFGFPPKLFGFKKGETSYNFNLFPIGGYVKIYGENSEEEEGNLKDKDRSFKSKPLWKQALVLIAGVTMNFLLAWILLSVSYMSGLPASVSNAGDKYKVTDQALTVINVLPNTPASIAGLKAGDKIISLYTEKDSVSVIAPEELKSFIMNHPSDEIFIKIENPDGPKDIVVKPEMKDGVPVIGISMDIIGELKLPFHKALLEGLKLSWNMTRDTVLGFYNLIKDGIQGKGDISSLSGPVGIVGIVGDAAKFGFIYLLSFTALISINLAVLNLIPFPALDGGQLLFLLIEKIKGSRINPKVANTVNGIGFLILIILMILITYHDIVKLF